MIKISQYWQKIFRPLRWINFIDRYNNMRIKTLDILLWVLSIVCTFLALKTCMEPIPSIFKDTWIDSFFKPFATGNSIIFKISIGFLVSMFFYLLVVWYPAKRKKIIIKHNLEETYRSFKSDTISILINACNNGGGGYDPLLIDKLSNQNEFRKYFNEKITEDQNRWHAVFNGLDAYFINKLLVELEILLHEVTFVLSNVYINDENVFFFFKRLSQSVYKLKYSTLDHDDLRSLTLFLWQIFAGWSLVDGYREDEIVKVMIDKI